MSPVSISGGILWAYGDCVMGNEVTVLELRIVINSDSDIIYCSAVNKVEYKLERSVR